MEGALWEGKTGGKLRARGRVMEWEKHGLERDRSGAHFTIHTNIKALCCTPETNVMLCIHHTSIKKERRA